MARNQKELTFGDGITAFWIFLSIVVITVKDLLNNPFLSSICIGAAVPLVLLSFLVLTQVKRIKRANLLARDSFFHNYSPTEFEYVTAELFRRFGYKADVTPQSGDQGIDIVLKKQDRIIGVQCKRYNIQNKIGPNLIREFIGALDGRGLKSGYFVTTSEFTRAAKETARKSRYQIKLLSGEDLGELRTRIDNRVMTGLIPKKWWYKLDDWQKGIAISSFILFVMVIISGISYIILI